MHWTHEEITWTQEDELVWKYCASGLVAAVLDGDAPRPLHVARLKELRAKFERIFGEPPFYSGSF